MSFNFGIPQKGEVLDGFLDAYLHEFFGEDSWAPTVRGNVALETVSGWTTAPAGDMWRCGNAVFGRVTATVSGAMTWTTATEGLEIEMGSLMRPSLVSTIGTQFHSGVWFDSSTGRFYPVQGVMFSDSTLDRFWLRPYRWNAQRACWDNSFITKAVWAIDDAGANVAPASGDILRLHFMVPVLTIGAR